MSYVDRLRYRAGEYGQLNTLPATFSLAFILVSLYQFGAMTAISLNWVSFTLETAYVLPVSAGAVVLAFASSETRDWRKYELPEQLLIGAMVVVVFGWTLTPPDFWAANLPWVGQFVHDTLTSIGSPLAGQLAFVIALLGWGALVN